MDLRKVYGECWGGEAGEWNTSLLNKYLEYMFARFLEENFEIKKNFHILNIGIGAGYWDRYLSYKVPEGKLTSIDIDPECADNFRACLENEKNTNLIEVLCADAMTYEFDGKYDLITMVGSVIDESGNAEKMLSKAISLLKDDGAIYLQMSRKGSGFETETFCEEHGASVEKKFVDDKYGIHAEYYRIRKK